MDDWCTLTMDGANNLHDHAPVQNTGCWRLIVLNICNITALTYFAYTMISLTSTLEGTGESIALTVSVLR